MADKQASRPNKERNFLRRGGERVEQREREREREVSLATMASLSGTKQQRRSYNSGNSEKRVCLVAPGKKQDRSAFSDDDESTDSSSSYESTDSEGNRGKKSDSKRRSNEGESDREESEESEEEDEKKEDSEDEKCKAKEMLDNATPEETVLAFRLKDLPTPFAKIQELKRHYEADFDNLTIGDPTHFREPLSSFGSSSSASQTLRQFLHYQLQGLSCERRCLTRDGQASVFLASKTPSIREWHKEINEALYDSEGRYCEYMLRMPFFGISRKFFHADALQRFVFYRIFANISQSITPNSKPEDIFPVFFADSPFLGRKMSTWFDLMSIEPITLPQREQSVVCVYFHGVDLHGLVFGQGPYECGNLFALHGEGRDAFQRAWEIVGGKTQTLIDPDKLTGTIKDQNIYFETYLQQLIKYCNDNPVFQRLLKCSFPARLVYVNLRGEVCDAAIWRHLRQQICNEADCTTPLPEEVYSSQADKVKIQRKIDKYNKYVCIWDYDWHGHGKNKTKSSAQSSRVAPWKAKLHKLTRDKNIKKENWREVLQGFGPLRFLQGYGPVRTSSEVNDEKEAKTRVKDLRQAISILTSHALKMYGPTYGKVYVICMRQKWMREINAILMREVHFIKHKQGKEESESESELEGEEAGHQSPSLHCASCAGGDGCKCTVLSMAMFLLEKEDIDLMRLSEQGVFYRTRGVL